MEQELTTHLARKNEFFVSGYLADEPKTGYTKNKMLVAVIRLMQNNRHMEIDKTGASKWTNDKPSVFFIDAFDTERYQMANKVLKHCHRGTYVLCRCLVRPESWQDKDGKWQNRTRFIMQELIIANNKSSFEKENAELQELLAELNSSIDDTVESLPEYSPDEFFSNEY